MGYSTVDGPVGKGLGSFNNTASTESDFEKVLELIGRMGNARVGSQAERDALTGSQLFDGLLFADKDTGAVYRYKSGWQAIYRPATAEGSVILTPGTNMTLSNNQLFTRNGFLLGTFEWSKAGSALSHADNIAILGVGFRPLQEYVVHMVASPAPSQIGMLIVTPAGEIRAISPIAGRTNGSVKVVVPIAM